MVDPLAPGVTKPSLLSFRGFMRSAGIPRLYPFLVVVGAVALASGLTLVSPFTRTVARADCSASSPCPTPTPVNAFLSLDVSQGPAKTVINVTGGQFNPNQQTSLYWDTPNHVAGAVTADAGGSFNTRVMPFAGDAPGVHHLCASVAPHPCANFTLLSATPSPSPSPSPVESPSASPSPTATPVLIASPPRVTGSLSGFDVISRPPFVFLPIFGIGALLLSLGYWGVTALRRPRGLTKMPSAAVVHRATRPDYSAGFGAAPPAPAPQSQPSAWDEPMRATPPASPTPPGPAEPPAPEPPAPATPAAPTPLSPETTAAPIEWGPPVEWGTGGTADWGFPEPPQDAGPDAPEPRD